MHEWICYEYVKHLTLWFLWPIEALVSWICTNILCFFLFLLVFDNIDSKNLWCDDSLNFYCFPACKDVLRLQKVHVCTVFRNCISPACDYVYVFIFMRTLEVSEILKFLHMPKQFRYQLFLCELSVLLFDFLFVGYVWRISHFLSHIEVFNFSILCLFSCFTRFQRLSFSLTHKVFQDVELFCVLRI